MYNKNLVSVGIPAFNRADKIERTIDSILAQSYKYLELIISDDASTDCTWQICNEYARKDKRVRCFRQKSNLGLNENFSFLLRQGRGEYFLWINDDDYCHPDFLLKLKNALDKHRSYGIAMSSLKQIFDDGQVKNEIIYKGKNNVTNYSPGQIFNAAIFYNPRIHLFTLGLWRRKVLDQLFIRPLPVTTGVDKILVCEASFMTRFYSVPEILFYKTLYRVNMFERPSYGDYRRLYLKDRVKINYTITLILWLLTSPNISIQQKIFSLPPKLFLILWSMKFELLKEILINFRNII